MGLDVTRVDHSNVTLPRLVVMAPVQLDREGRLLTAMCYHIWIAIEGADDDEEKEGRDPMTSAKLSVHWQLPLLTSWTSAASRRKSFSTFGVRGRPS